MSHRHPFLMSCNSSEHSGDAAFLDEMSSGALRELRRAIDARLEPEPSGPEPRAGAPRACRLFTVSEGVRRLEGPQLEALTRAFEAWVEAARDERIRRSRERVFLVYLLLRYTGARLGEVLALDERSHFDFRRGVVAIPAEPGESPPQCDTATAENAAREVPLPDDVIDRIRRYCARHDPDSSNSMAPFDKSAIPRERLFDVDPGFVRRKFQEQEAAAGLPKELLNPRVLRASRAIELLQGGMPLRAVQALLGHARADLTASYVTLADEDARRIIHTHCAREFSHQTSARNMFRGTITRIEGSALQCRVTLRTAGGDELAAHITTRSRRRLALEEGVRVTALVKATQAEALLPAEASTGVNALPCVVTRVEDDGVFAEVTGVLRDGAAVCALLPSTEARRRGFDVGTSFLFRCAAHGVVLL